MGNWTTITVAGIVAAAPNILGATITPVYSCPFNDSMYQLQVSITVDTTSARLKRIHIVNSLTGTEIVPAIFRPAAGWTSPVTFTSDAFAQTRAIQNGILTFYVENDIGNTTAGAVSVAFTVQASAVTGFTSAVEGGAGRYIAPGDVATRLESLTVAFVPILNGGQVPQNVTYLLSKDNGATFTWIGWQMMKTVGQQILIPTLVPGTSQTWKVAACTGAVPSTSTPVTAANIATLFPGIAISAGFAVAALVVPIATLIPNSDMSVPAPTLVAPATASYPYNAKRPDGSQYWVIPSVTVVSTGAVGASNAFYLRVTAQDLSAAKTAVGAERPYDGAQVGLTAETFVFHPLMGDYGLNGDGFIRSGSIGYVRLKLYVCNRVDQTSYSFANALCAKQQAQVGGGLGYLDVLVASGATIPAGAMDPSRLDTTLWPQPGNITGGTPTSRPVDANLVEVTWPYTAPGDAYFTGVLVEVEDPDQGAFAQAKSDGTTPWDGSYALTGDKAPRGVALQYKPSNPQPIAVRVPALNYARNIRIRARSYSVNVTNATGPEAVLSIPAYTVPKQNAGTAYTSCVGGITASAGAPFTVDGKLQNAIACTLTGLPITDLTWTGYVIVVQYPNGDRITVTGPETANGKGIYLGTPASMMTLILWAVSVSLDSANNLRTNPIVPGVTPSTTIYIGTTGYTIPPVAPPVTADMSMSVIITSGPPTPAGLETYGWHGAVVPPTDPTFYEGCEITVQYQGEVEGGAFAKLPKGLQEFHNGYWPRPTYSTQVTFRAYPVNKDGQRGAAVPRVVTLDPHAQNTLNLNQANQNTIGTGVIIDPVTGNIRWGTGNPASSLLLDWDFSLSLLGQINNPVTSQWSCTGTAVVQNDSIMGHYCHLENIGSSVLQTFAIASGEKVFFTCRVRSTVDYSEYQSYIYWYNGVGTLISTDNMGGAYFLGSAGAWSQHGCITALVAPTNAAKGILKIALTHAGYVDVGQIVLSPRF